MSVKRLIITSCTAKKADVLKPAKYLYEGLGHRYILDGVRIIRETLGDDAIDLNIISAKHGLLDENDLVEPYDMTFRTMSLQDSLKQSRKLKLSERVAEKIRDYHIVIYCLGKEYIQAMELPFFYDGCTSHMFLLGPSHENLLEFDPAHTNYHLISAGGELAKQLGVMTINLKGYIIKKLGEKVRAEYDNVFVDPILNTISDPGIFNMFIDELVQERVREKKRQTTLF